MLRLAAVLSACLCAAVPALAQDKPPQQEQKPPPQPAPNDKSTPQEAPQHNQPQVPPVRGSNEWYLQPGFAGFKLAKGDMGDLNMSLYTYFRYLNQKSTDDTYTDSFGRTKNIDQRNDVQLQKVKITFKGWFADPDFGYNAYVWTSNSAQGQGAQVVGAGWLTYRIVDQLTVAGGIWSLPSVRSLEGEFPKFLRTDSRTIADEFFRGAYTSGIWAMGSLTPNLTYRVMLANNLSALGVDTGQLDGKMDTVSGVLTWYPSTGEYGDGGGFGDFDPHQEVATRIGIHGTRSTETRQSQPGENVPENTQVRLSDGTGLFEIDAFGPGTQVEKALYQMISVDAGIKYGGFALEGEYYLRWLTNLQGAGPFPNPRIFDHGFQLQASYMILPKKLMTYASGSKIFGEYGDPWDLAVGFNWFPVTKAGYERQLRINPEVMYVRKSPTGNSSVPYSVGSNGIIFLIATELSF